MSRTVQMQPNIKTSMQLCTQLRPQLQLRTQLMSANHGYVSCYWISEQQCSRTTQSCLSTYRNSFHEFLSPIAAGQNVPRALMHICKPLSPRLLMDSSIG